MDRLLRPKEFDKDPLSPSCSRDWAHWKVMFTKFLANVENVTDTIKLDLLIGHVSSSVYEYFADAPDYKTAIECLDKVFKPTKSVLYCRHVLLNCKQESGESIHIYFQRLKTLVRECAYTAVTKADHENESMRDAFISGIQSVDIRQKLLESVKNDLTSIYELASSLELARSHNQVFSQHNHKPVNAITNDDGNMSDNSHPGELGETAAALPAKRKYSSTFKCYFCGGSNRHASRTECPAYDQNCHACGTKGHFAKVCKDPHKNKKRTSNSQPHSSAIHYVAASPPSLARSTRKVTVNGKQLDALIDSGSSITLLNHEVATKFGWPLIKSKCTESVSMASSNHVSESSNYCVLDISFTNDTFKSRKVTVMNNLCSDLIVGLDILAQYSSITLELGGQKEAAVIASVADVPPPLLFTELDPNCKPIAVKSRRYSEYDKNFIKAEIDNLLKNDKIEECRSPWRAQVFVHKGGEFHKPRMVIDYSKTINRYTTKDAFPVPRIDEMVEDLSKNRYYTTFDLTAAYHQVPISESERKYTAFEACGKLYQFKFIPFGVTNGVSAFQRTVQKIKDEEDLEGIHIYVDNMTIGGDTIEDHDKKVAEFEAAAAKYNLCFNDSKTVRCVESISILGYLVSHNSIKPDPERLKPLLEMPAPEDEKALASVLGLFAHYSKWIKNFSDKIHPLTHVTSFPLNEEAMNTFSSLKSEVAKSVLVTPDLRKPFVVETDASDYGIGAVLTQSGQAVAFFSRTLNQSERKHHSVEKEAYAIVESMKKWSHYLLGSHFSCVTDQRSVSFMFDQTHHGKIKNDKIARWRIELSPFNFDIIHRPGKYNITADCLSRSHYCSSVELRKLHDQLCHPGVTRLTHFVRSRNLPYSVSDVKQITSTCKECSELKPRFFKPKDRQYLIKAMAAFDRLNIDFKGPLPSNTSNKYMLTVVDEYSRYPFAFPAPDTSAKSIMKCLTSVFVLFTMPNYVHSDRGSGFMSKELNDWLLEKGIAMSHSTPFNPQGNGQVERYNGTIWKAVQFALKSHKLDIKCWEEVLPDALHSIRSLLCTATNETPHERVFKFPRKSTNGSAIPSWLVGDSKALLKCHTNSSKYSPKVEEVDILHVNPSYSHVRTAGGREITVSNKHLAPLAAGEGGVGDAGVNISEHYDLSENLTENLPIVHENEPIITITNDDTCKIKVNVDTPVNLDTPEVDSTNNIGTENLRRSSRNRSKPDHYGNPVSHA